MPSLIDTNIVSADGRSLVSDTGGIAQLIGNALQKKQGLDREDARLQQVDQAKRVQDQTRITQAQLFRIREIKDPVTKRMEIAKLGLSENEAGRESGKFVEILNETTPDNLNLAITRVATGLGNVDKVLDKITGKGAGVKSFSPITIVNPATKEKRLVSPTVNNAGQAVLETFDLPEGFEVSRETAGEKRAADVLAKAETQQIVGDIKVGQDVEKAGKAEAAKLGEQLKLKPKVEQAVAETLVTVREGTKLKTEARSNNKAFKIYNTAMSTLVNALSETISGPFVGLLPALTANQQIADGATAAMAPVLKTLFRESGEGTFTKDDQEILLDMLPKRTDRPAVQRSKLQNIDAIVRIKLGREIDNKPPPEGITEDDIAETMRVNNMTREEVMQRLRVQ